MSVCLSERMYACLYVSPQENMYKSKTENSYKKQYAREERTPQRRNEKTTTTKQLEYYQNASRLCRLEACQPGCQAASHNNIDIQTDRHTNIHCRQMDGRTDGTDRLKQTSQYPTKQKKTIKQPETHAKQSELLRDG